VHEYSCIAHPWHKAYFPHENLSKVLFSYYHIWLSIHLVVYLVILIFVIKYANKPLFIWNLYYQPHPQYYDKKEGLFMSLPDLQVQFMMLKDLRCFIILLLWLQGPDQKEMFMNLQMVFYNLSSYAILDLKDMFISYHTKITIYNYHLILQILKVWFNHRDLPTIIPFIIVKRGQIHKSLTVLVIIMA